MVEREEKKPTDTSSQCLEKAVGIYVGLESVEKSIPLWERERKLSGKEQSISRRKRQLGPQLHKAGLPMGKESWDRGNCIHSQMLLTEGDRKELPDMGGHTLQGEEPCTCWEPNNSFLAPRLPSPLKSHTLVNRPGAQKQE